MRIHFHTTKYELTVSSQYNSLTKITISEHIEKSEDSQLHDVVITVRMGY